MSFLVIARERYSLRIGENTLGGRGVGAVAAPALAGLPVFAVITVVPGTPTSIRSTGVTLPVRVEGFMLGSEPRQLRHGARIEFRDCRIRYGELSLVDSTSSLVGIDDEYLASIPPEIPASEGANDFGARLIDMAQGAVYGVPPSGLHIGRDPVCQVVLSATSVSRHHALIAPSLRGYTVTDRSINGVHVNGTKIQGAQLLSHGDVIRIGDRDFRFEAVASAIKPTPDRGQSSVSLATVEVISDGPLKGTRFSVERPVVHIGRGPENDIHIADDSVSASHATLLRRGARWHLIDLASTNGTFIGGTRVETEAVVQGGQEIRLGAVKLLFRPAGRTGETGSYRLGGRQDGRTGVHEKA